MGLIASTPSIGPLFIFAALLIPFTLFTPSPVVYDTSQVLMENLAVEAFQVALVRTKARIVEGDAGKAICKEADRLKPAAVVMGTRGRSLIQSVLQGSVSEYCFHNCKSAPVIIVPGKDSGDESII
ncbi:Adenine nucleotide alpha hydrolases-like protein [Dioscorea alata]|uniref:Adenine nucleotide alpha hydrolases-like protein n=1 Tax=Dioscorea alata TaxID=55571 RepID=A0ACB7UER6_DIOAL|nr:Adenine nucleotide alpha hydrolases-like protein [Dioscorea alata]